MQTSDRRCCSECCRAAQEAYAWISFINYSYWVIEALSICQGQLHTAYCALHWWSVKRAKCALGVTLQCPSEAVQLAWQPTDHPTFVSGCLVKQDICCHNSWYRLVTKIWEQQYGTTTVVIVVSSLWWISWYLGGIKGLITANACSVKCALLLQVGAPMSQDALHITVWQGTCFWRELLHLYQGLVSTDDAQLLLPLEYTVRDTYLADDTLGFFLDILCFCVVIEYSMKYKQT